MNKLKNTLVNRIEEFLSLTNQMNQDKNKLKTINEHIDTIKIESKFIANDLKNMENRNQLINEEILQINKILEENNITLETEKRQSETINQLINENNNLVSNLQLKYNHSNQINKLLQQRNITLMNEIRINNNQLKDIVMKNVTQSIYCTIVTPNIQAYVEDDDLAKFQTGYVLILLKLLLR